MRKIAISAGKILLFLAIWMGLYAAAIAFVVIAGGGEWYHKLGWRYLAEIGGALAVFSSLLIMALAIDKRGLSSLGFPLRSGPAELLIGAFFGGLIFLVPVGLLVSSGAARIDADLDHFNLTALLAGLGFTLFNVIYQELLVRSYMFQELWAKFGALAATIVTTLFFVALHYDAIISRPQGLIVGVNLLLASVLLSLAYVRSGALWLPIGIHFGWNGVQGPILQINVTGADIALGDWRFFSFSGPDLWTGGQLGVEGGLAGLAGPAVGIAALIFLTRQRRRLA